MSAASSCQVKSVCPYCGVGCGIVMDVVDEQIIKVSGDKQHPSNSGRLCTKGTTCNQAIAGSGRLEHAYQRTERQADPVRMAMDQAIENAAKRLAKLRDDYGANAIALYVSGQMSLEAQYLANKLAKGFIRTQHIESNSRLCMASAGSGYKLSLGADAPPGSYEDFDKADVFLVTGANMADCHPILFLRMMDRVKAGAKLIVVDPRRTATADKANLYLPIKPGTDLALLNGLLYLLHQNGHTDKNFISQYTEGWETLPIFLQDYKPDQVAAITGLEVQALEQAAQWIGEADNWMSCWTMGLNQSTHGTWNTNAVCNLHLATGAICKPGSGPFSLTGQPNAMGGREMGYMGPGLPGQRSLLNPADRRFTESIWQLPEGTLGGDGGSGTVDMFNAMKTGDIKACWIICTNPVASAANRQSVIDALQQSELIITQDAYLDTETNRYADILLPGALWAEAEGVMINSERNLTLMQQAVKPPADALPDWQIIARIAQGMGYAEAFNYQSAEEVFEEIKQFWNPATGYDIRGASYARLKQSSLQWPCPPDDDANRHPVRYLNTGISQHLRTNADGKQPRFNFATNNGKAQFFARPHMNPAEMPDEEFPLVLNTGRLQHQWHTLTKTGKINTLNKLNPGPFVEINPEDAVRFTLQHKGKARLNSRRGSAVLPVIVSDRVQPGNCFVPFHWNDVFGEELAINALTSDATDAISAQPEFKFCAVALVPVSGPIEEKPTQKIQSTGGLQPLQSVPLDEASCMTLIETLNTTLNLETSLKPSFNTEEQQYLSGFITGLEATAKSMQAIPALGQDAPVREDYKHWINGLLAGMFSRVLPLDVEKNSGPVITLLWASQTGNAEALAQTFAEQLQGTGWQVNLQSMNDYSLQQLTQDKLAVFITSTFGDGDAPDSGEDFWRQLTAEGAPSLDTLEFSLLALGDSNYDQFCGHGKQLEARLLQLGAKALIARTDCDSDYEEPAQHWFNQLQKSLEKKHAPGNAKIIAPRTAPASSLSSNSQPGFTKNNPFPSRLIINQRLNSEASAKDIRQFGFDTQGSDIRYSAGDALGVWPRNCPALVHELINNLKLNADTSVLVDTYEKPLQLALEEDFEICKPSPEMLKLIAKKNGNKQLLARLDSADKSELNDWLWGRQLVDILHDLPLRCDAEEFLLTLKRLQPRLYSIASSPLLHPDQIHLTVSAVRYTRYSGGKQLRKGVCSTFLADRADEQSVPVYLQPSKHFRLPEDDTAPVIMVGPGTGIAPFRAFLQERQARGASGKNWLFFGEQHIDRDFYYKDELLQFQKNGVLNDLSLAFSRDQAQKIYVQNRMRENGEKIWNWLEQGAYFYVCGDASRMAKDVDQALRAIISHYGEMDEVETVNYIRKLNMSKRYLRDVY